MIATKIYLDELLEDIGRNNAQWSHLRKALAQLHIVSPSETPNIILSTMLQIQRGSNSMQYEAALNNVLEVTFAPRGRKDESAPCPFEFQERGPGLVAVVDVLTAALNEFPDSVLLRKWVHDLWRTTIYHNECAKQAVPSSTTNTENAKGDSEALDIDAGTYYQRSRWKGQAGHLNYRIAQFQRLREGLYIFNSCQKPLEGGDRVIGGQLPTGKRSERQSTVAGRLGALPPVI
ncbi:uncharacterized protein F5147DRAFT_661346 [Suillus discolor]|uniref:Uncharacterized protein n=1 Tax=Suillus discolor TaxID=1912936 RepID=A0A9P7JKH2_9AGAM|nr:uncharacterized protein F5147DRAFT_661346 [Suillus discolor]KAG2080281.1 hypothetical protein F5147DRAFT_661346 [Suillus discolor]